MTDLDVLVSLPKERDENDAADFWGIFQKDTAGKRGEREAREQMMDNKALKAAQDLAQQPLA